MTSKAVDYRGIVALVGSAGVAALLTIGYIVYVGRVLGPEEYADFAASLSVIYFVAVAVSPLTPTIGRLAARYASAGRFSAVSALRSQIFARIALVSVAVAAAGAALSPLLARTLKFRTPLALFLSFCIVLLYTVVSADRGFIHGLLLFRVHNINTLVEAFIRAAGALVFLRFSQSASFALFSYVLGLAVAEAMLLLRFRRQAEASEKPAVEWDEVWRLTIPMVVLMFAVAVFQNVDMLVVKRFFPREMSGVYGAATALARGIGVIFVPLYVMAGPVLTNLHTAGKPVFGATLRLTAVFAALSAVAVVIMLFWSEPIVAILYGPQYAAAASLLAPLAGVGVITYIALLLSQALITLARFRFLAAYAVFAIVQVIVLARYHHSFSEVLLALYLVQGATLIAVALAFIGAARSTRAG